LRTVTSLRCLAVLSLLAACADNAPTVDDDAPSGDSDLGLGDQLPDDTKADGNWGHALECKDIPDLPPLVNPKITLSIDGLTLHLTDATTGYDKVFPVGPGQIEHDPEAAGFGESHSYYPIIATGRQDFQITPSTIQLCKTWWTDPATGAKSPVFAGLPFMSFYGNYAIHGPIDNYRAANGGNLRRGYVSHGCFRMEAADVLEVYARIKGVAKVPVHLQREPERTAEGAKIDLPNKWIGAACSTDAECGYANGFCAKNPFTEQGFCSAHCTTFCDDHAGSPTTFCVANPDEPGTGMCVNKALSTNFECRPYDHLGVETLERNNNPSVKADVCVPKSRGWVGDHCFTNSDCTSGTSCSGATETHAGVCTMACEHFCSDQPGVADTFCADVPALNLVEGSGSCVRQCTPSSNASECPTDMQCVAQARFDQPGVVRNVCVPRVGPPDVSPHG
jgi:hypothetical protein